MARYDLDHLTLGVRHLYASCERLRNDHGLQSHEGGPGAFVPAPTTISRRSPAGSTARS